MPDKTLRLTIPPGVCDGRVYEVRLEDGAAVLVEAAAGALGLVAVRSARGSKRAAVRVTAAEGASIDIVTIHDAGAGAEEEISWDVSVERGARVSHADFVAGSGVVKNDLRVRLSGEAASADLSGLSVLSGGRLHNNTVVTHEAPETVSRQKFKDILSGSARSEYSGLVHVTKDAPRSDSNQICRNLLLSSAAHATSRPELKIDTDDVKCSHGSATGELSQAELFYLRSRGLSPEEARGMLIEGFAEEIVLGVANPALRNEAHRLVRSELERAAGLRPEEALR